MSRRLARVLYAAAAASLAITTMSFSGAGAAGAATAAPQSEPPQAVGPPGYSTAWSGYGVGGGRWFRYLSTTLTVPPRMLPAANSGDAVIRLQWAHQNGIPDAGFIVQPGGGPGTVEVTSHPGDSQILGLSPKVGDRLTVSIYYDQKGHDYFTATDLTQHTTQTVQTTVGNVVYDSGFVGAVATGTVSPPQADTQLWHFTNSHVTTYSGDRGTLLGPWTTSETIATTTGTAAGTVKLSPSPLSNGGQDFTVWLRRAVPGRPMPGVTLGVTAQGNTWTELFYTGTSAQVWRVHLSNMAQHIPQSWGGKLVGGPAAVWIPPGTFPISGLAVFGRGTDNRLWWRHEGSGWQCLGGRLTSKPTVHFGGALAPGALTVFVRGDNGAVWGGALHGTGNPGQLEWTGWVSLGGRLLAGTGPVSVGNASGAFVVAVGTNRVVYVAERLAGWQKWTWRPIGGKTTADPGIASPSPNAVVAFVRGTDNAAWYNEFFGHTSGVTAGWHSMGGNLTSGVTALTQQELGVYYRTSVYGLGTGNGPWYKTGMWPALSDWWPVRIDY
jgi:hypothetical protein